MKLLLYLQIKPIESIRYSNPVVNQLKEALKKLVIFEADQNSDLQQILIGKELLSKAERVAVYFDTYPDLKISGLAELFEVMRKLDIPILIQHEGEHQTVHNMLKILKGAQIMSPDVDALKDFLNSM